MDKVDDFIGEGKPLADRWREVLNREYVPKSDLRRLIKDWEYWYTRSDDIGWRCIQSAKKLLEDE